MESVIATGVLVSILLMAMLATLFERLSRHVDEIDSKLSAVASRLTDRIDGVDASVGSAQVDIRARLEAVTTRLDGLAAEASSTSGRVLRLEQRS
jgi:phage-related minor tail protein